MKLPFACDLGAAVNTMAELPPTTSKPEQPISQWYAAYTFPRHEKCVARQLDEKSIDSFLPLYRSLRRWKDRRKQIELPLFPGYVFVHFDLQQRLRILGLPGVVRLVSFNGQPAMLPEHDIETLCKGLDLQIYAEPHYTPHRIIPGSDLASARLPPQAQGRRNEMGIRHLGHRAISVLNQLSPLLRLFVA